MAKDFIREYAEALAAIPPAATEISYRSAQEKLLRDAAAALAAENEIGESFEILNEPQRESGAGAPDFRVAARGHGVVGYVESKAPGAHLESIARGAQMEKYRDLSENIVLTDTRVFLLLRAGKIIASANLSDSDASPRLSLAPDMAKQDRDDLRRLLKRFLRYPPSALADAKQLAVYLADPCRDLRDGLAAILSDPNIKATRLRGLLQEFRRCVTDNLSEEQFADVFAQTLVYGLFMARLNAPSGEQIDFHSQRHIPQNFALVSELVDFLPELQKPDYESILWIGEDILAIVRAIDVAKIKRSLSFDGKKRSLSFGGKRRDSDSADNKERDADPYVYFYEHFLAKYDPKLRQTRGVYYTPPPVVKFIVQAARDVARRDFGKLGLADEGVYVLDFAAGTGTFLLEAMRLELAGKEKIERKMLARDQLTRNFFGFEFMIAPYAIAHLKLSQFLADAGCGLGKNDRLRVYLTNTLEPLPKETELPNLLPALSEDTRRAQKVKDKTPILAVVGNPPYSGVSQNRGAWIGGLIDDYKRADGAPLGERNTKWLQDDYVKFIRFAQWKIEQAKRGVVAIVTNHAFLDNPTFRGMRQSLLSTFDRLYFLDLHGNSKKRERAPDGGKDENVFDIQQGVAISILVKNPEAKEKSVFHADFWGKRESKYESCLASTIDSVRWRKIAPDKPQYLFIPRDKATATAYEKFRRVSDIFRTHSAGIVTARDKLTIGFEDYSLRKRIREFAALPPETARVKFGLGPDAQDWKVALAQADLRETGLDNKRICEIAYRPFDSRFTYYTGKSRGFHCRPRNAVMRHMLDGDNIGLVSVRQVAENAFTHAIVVDKIIESRMTLSNKGIGYLYPLFLRDEKSGAKIENLSPDFRLWIDSRYGRAFSARDIFNCIYAVLHSPDYRRRYAEFLRTDFPRVPFPQAESEFIRLAKIGGALVDAHLFTAPKIKTGSLMRGADDCKIDKCKHDAVRDRLWFNTDGYFEPLPREVWEFEIGGYQPLKKYLQARKGRDLSTRDKETIRAAANAIAFTIKKMGEIDP